MMEIINTSGEPREYEENGVIYEFPYPSDKPTQVQDHIARKLLATGQFKEFNKRVEDKEEFSEKSYREELIDLKGIGTKTADDIMRVYPTREKLFEALGSGKGLPFDDDVSSLLRKHYGGN